jgi:protein SCO1/2
MIARIIRPWHWLPALVLALWAAPVAGGPHDLSLQTERRQVGIPIGGFALTDQSAKPFHFKDLAGKVAVVTFAYTTCTDVCPLITAAARQVQSGLSASERQRVHLLTITTDPEIDSPKVLAGYGKRHGADFANWSFLTGPESELKKVWKNFGVGVKRKGRGIVEHTPLTAVIDQDGVMRYIYIGPSPEPQQVLIDVRALLAKR